MSSIQAVSSLVTTLVVTLLADLTRYHVELKPNGEACDDAFRRACEHNGARRSTRIIIILRQDLADKSSTLRAPRSMTVSEFKPCCFP